MLANKRHTLAGNAKNNPRLPAVATPARAWQLASNCHARRNARVGLHLQRRANATTARMNWGS
eukprot:7544254-Lingulodinium_polyedra.AAC.1